jgi:hypothetical protein
VVTPRPKHFVEELDPIRVDTAQFFTGATKQGPNAILRNPSCHADFVVTPTLEVVKPDDVAFGTFQLRQKPLDLISVTQNGGGLRVRIGNIPVELA